MGESFEADERMPAVGSPEHLIEPEATSQPGAGIHIDRISLLRSSAAQSPLRSEAALTATDSARPQNDAQQVLEIPPIPQPGSAVVNLDNPDVDPRRPTVAFIDDFNTNPGDVELNGPQHRLSHGDTSAVPAREEGYNVQRLQMNAVRKVDFQGHADFSIYLDAVEQQIESGQLRLGRGDVVNLSLGQNPNGITGSGDPTFEEASRMLGFKVTPENLKSKRGAILARMDEIAKDTFDSPFVRSRAAAIVRTNQAIERLQKRGIEVVVAAGNNGPDHFSMDFLMADHQLANTTPDGRYQPMSERSSLTVPAQGTYDVRYQPVDLFDPTPLREQEGSFTIGKHVYLSAKDYGGGRLGSAPTEIVHGVPHFPQMTDGEMLGSSKELRSMPVPRVDYPADDYRGQGYVLTRAIGTSFSNIDWLARNKARLTEKKTGR